MAAGPWEPAPAPAVEPIVFSAMSSARAALQQEWPLAPILGGSTPRTGGRVSAFTTTQAVFSAVRFPAAMRFAYMVEFVALDNYGPGPWSPPEAPPPGAVGFEVETPATLDDIEVAGTLTTQLNLGSPDDTWPYPRLNFLSNALLIPGPYWSLSSTTLSIAEMDQSAFIASTPIATGTPSGDPVAGVVQWDEEFTWPLSGPALVGSGPQWLRGVTPPMGDIGYSMQANMVLGCEALVTRGRWRWLYDAQGVWRLRQRQSRSGSDSWTLRQRQNAGSGSWGLRQRQRGL